MNRTEFATLLRTSLIEELRSFRERNPGETPYALALLPGQCGDGLDYAIATEEGLQRVAAKYYEMGYRYRKRWRWEAADSLEKLVEYLRWANPDDGWHYGDFDARPRVMKSFQRLVAQGKFGEEASELEEFCTEVLASLQDDPAWQSLASDHPVIVGVTWGSNPRDFLLTATRANRFAAAQALWGEFWRGEEVGARIQRRRSKPN